MLYALFTLLAVLVTVVLCLPFLRRRGGLPDRNAYDVALYRKQLSELQVELDAGVVPREEAAAARIEIERRLLRASERHEQPGSAASPAGQRGWAVAVALTTVILAAVTYAALGNPGLPDTPAVREADVAAEDATPDELAVRMAAVMRTRPDEMQGWLMLGPLARSVGRYDLAAEAYANAARLEPGRVEHWLALGQAYVARDAGMVNREARAAFDKALLLTPGEPMARYYLGLADFQDHKDRAAFDRWTALAADTPPDAAWAEILQRGLDRAARRLGLPASAAVAAPAPGPSAADVAAAQEMAPEDRSAMIEGMVQRLAARLEETPEDLEGWLRLGRAYTVLERTDEAAAAYAQALRIDPGNVQAKDALAALKAD
ncbi:c-type cytochrome biogenesis protein CcmI [Iodidimonas sp. SYSU 1G8]|uniref:c-type cytochrome biogenesis protein CcmI n=1 Tax=Iodidimonas sp. SYSU 1G8 TaxID=3133967 RepID=UPI0031FEF7F2